MTTRSLFLLLLYVSFVESISFVKDKTNTEEFMDRQRNRREGAGVLIFADRKDKTAKTLAKDHPHLEFTHCYEKQVAVELNFEFPSILLLRDEETLSPPETIEFGNTEAIDLWLMRKWFPTVTELSMGNQKIIFSPDTGPTMTLLYLDQLGSERKDHLDAFRSVAKMWTTKELRNDLPRAVYASKYQLLKRIETEKESGYILAVNSFWKSFEETFLRLIENQTSSENLIMMISMHDPTGMKKETFKGDKSDSSALSSWVSSIVRKWNGQVGVISLPSSSSSSSRSIEL